MTRAEFVRLVKRGTLTLLFHNAETNVVSASASTGAAITMRPDLPGLPVTKKAPG